MVTRDILSKGKVSSGSHHELPVLSATTSVPSRSGRMPHGQGKGQASSLVTEKPKWLSRLPVKGRSE